MQGMGMHEDMMNLLRASGNYDLRCGCCLPLDKELTTVDSFTKGSSFNCPKTRTLLAIVVKLLAIASCVTLTLDPVLDFQKAFSLKTKIESLDAQHSARHSRLYPANATANTTANPSDEQHQQPPSLVTVYAYLGVLLWCFGLYLAHAYIRGVNKKRGQLGWVCSLCAILW